MSIDEFYNSVKNSKDKLGIFKNELNKYDISYEEAFNITEELLTDQEKADLLNLESFKNGPPSLRLDIINKINNSNIIYELLKDKEIIKDFKEDDYLTIIDKLEEHIKIKILENREMVEDNLKMSFNNIFRILLKIKSDEIKIKVKELYNFGKYEQNQIIKLCSDEYKLDFLKNDKDTSLIYKFEIIKFLKVENLKYIKDIIEEPDINYRRLMSGYSKEKQMKFIEMMDELELAEEQIKEVLVKLDKDLKAILRKDERYKEYWDILDIEVERTNIVIDYNDINKYKYLDNLILVNPLELTEYEKEKLKKLIEICPNIQISDNLRYYSTAQEYINGEKWIDEILSKIDSKWDDLEKIAYIDNKIGKKISYSPLYGTEVTNECNIRALWKIIDTGYGVCNGIAQIEKYILNKIGIEADLVDAEKHTFLKLRNIKIEEDSKETRIESIIIDPTWNLTAHQFDAMPSNFCRSYESIRKNDISKEGIDTECHKNDEKLSDCKIELSETKMREVFYNIGLLNEDKEFRIGELLKKSDKIDGFSGSIEEKIESKLKLIEEFNPKFTKHQNSTISIVSSLMSKNNKMEFEKIAINRVYKKEDPEKEPYMYIYVKENKDNELFYYADKEKNTFVKVNKNEFEKVFDCYNFDKKKTKGVRPWEEVKEVNKEENLRVSSGKIR